MSNINNFKKFNENLGDAVKKIEAMMKESEIKGSIKVLNELIKESENDELAKSNKLAQYVIYDLVNNKISKLEKELKELQNK